MENKNSTEEIIEPLCNLQKEEQQDVLEVHLQGFKKEQLRVIVNNHGVLTIRGERPVDENRRVRFCKEITISEHCKRDEIRAKFEGEILYITMAKRIPPVTTQNVEAGTSTALRMMMSKLTNCISRLQFAASRPQIGGKAALKLGVMASVVVVGAVGVYVAYKYRHTGFNSMLRTNSSHCIHV